MEENSYDYEELIACVEVNTQEVQKVNASIVHATTFLVLLCIFQIYGILCRARKKGGL